MDPKWRQFVNEPIVDKMLREARKRGVPTRAEERHLLIRAQGGDSEARDDLVVRNSPFVVTCMKSVAGYEAEYLDLFQEGLCGANKAIDKYDVENRTFRFISYAVWWIKQAMTIFARDTYGSIRVPANRHSEFGKIRRIMREAKCSGAGVTVEQVAEEVGLTKFAAEALMGVALPEVRLDVARRGDDEDGDSVVDMLGEWPDNSLADADEFAWAANILNTTHMLDERERRVIEQRFYHGRSLDSIAGDYGVSRERIRQIELRAMRRIRRVFMAHDRANGISRSQRLEMLEMGGRA